MDALFVLVDVLQVEELLLLGGLLGLVLGQGGLVTLDLVEDFGEVEGEEEEEEETGVVGEEVDHDYLL